MLVDNTLRSPGYPSNHPKNVECEYSVSIPNGGPLYISKTLMLRAIDIHEGETVFSHTSETTFLLRISLRAFFVGSYAVQRRRQILSKLIVLRKTRSLHWYSG